MALIRQSQNPKDTFSFSGPFGHTTKPKSPALLPKPLISCSNSRSATKIGNAYRQNLA